MNFLLRIIFVSSIILITSCATNLDVSKREPFHQYTQKPLKTIRSFQVYQSTEGEFIDYNPRHNRFSTQAHQGNKITTIPKGAKVTIDHVNFTSNPYLGGPFLPNIKHESILTAYITTKHPKTKKPLQVKYRWGTGFMAKGVRLNQAPWEPDSTDEDRFFTP